MVVVGVGFVLGDGVMTPSISVLSAVEGVRGVLPHTTQGHVVTATIAILLGIFAIQRYGTGRVSGLFAPVILLWLLLNAFVGLHNIIKHYPAVITAASPHHAVRLFMRDPVATWRKLSGVLLCVTGTEALFADLGHFSRRSIQLSCLGLVFPSLVLIYLGQAAYLIQHPYHATAVYWRSLPDAMYLPMLGLATLATITASQSLVSAVFSIVSQAISQGFFPKFSVLHTSRHHKGQVYIPLINAVMCALTVSVVLTFQQSASLGSAYGIAVICDMLITTAFMCLVMLLAWRTHIAMPVAFALVFGAIEGAFLSASVSKVFSGGWLSLAMAGVWGFLMWSWNWGSTARLKHARARTRKLRQLLKHEVWLDEDGQIEEKLSLAATGESVLRYSGVGFWYCETVEGVPPTLVDFLHKVPALQRMLFFVTNRHLALPEVHPDDRLLIEPLSVSGLYHVVARYGYMEPIEQGQDFSRHVIASLVKLLMQSNACSMVWAQPAPQIMPSTESHGHHRPSAPGLAPRSSAPTVAPTADEICPERGSPRHNTGGVNGSAGAHASAGKAAPAGGASKEARGQQQGGLQGRQQQQAGHGKSGAGPASHHAFWRSFSNSNAIGDNPLLTSAGPTLPFAGPPMAFGGMPGEEEQQRLLWLQVLAREVDLVRSSVAGGHMVYVFGRNSVRPRAGSNWLRRAVLELQVLVNHLTTRTYEQYGVPPSDVVEVAQVYDL